jgi:hypothetical protein
MVMSITAGVAGVMIFRPLTKQLGELLEQMRRDRQDHAELAGSTRMAQLLEGVLDRMERLESRQDFTERVIETAGWKGEAASSLPPRRAAEPPGRTEE